MECHSQGVFDAQGHRPAHRGDGWLALIHYCWFASFSDLRHRPLYFEDAMLERNGQTRHPLIQPMASAAGSS